MQEAEHLHRKQSNPQTIELEIIYIFCLFSAMLVLVFPSAFKVTHIQTF